MIIKQAQYLITCILNLKEFELLDKDFVMTILSTFMEDDLRKLAKFARKSRDVGDIGNKQELI